MAKPKRRGRKLLLLVGLGGAAAAGFAAFKRSAPKDDPWATPLQDPYIAPSAGRSSSTTPVTDTTPAATTEEEAAVDEEPTGTEETSAAEDAAGANVDTAKTVRGASAGD